ncbi:glycosyltransferase [Poseidonibacter antarcticus]|uniref:glycosyltransferase n=1 Tax=Poseidonibacter antarcticus TaxID=2478538 RepID=UPI0013CEC14E|nr:glycosyltransferase [Poseidonibacter antarcticus]
MENKKGLMIIDQISNGGAEKVFYKLYKYFSNSYGLEVFTILNTKSEWFVLNNKARFKTATNNNLNSNSTIGKIYLQISFMIKLFIDIRKHKYSFVFSFLERSNISSILVGNWFKTPVFINVRNHLSSQYRNRSNIERKLILFFIKNTYSKATKIICNSFEIKKDLVENFEIDENKIIVIYNSYNLKNIKKLSNKDNPFSEIINMYKNKNGKIFTSAGRFDSQKDFFTLVKTFKEHIKFYKNDLLILIGDGNDREEIEKLISNNKNIFLTGHITNPFTVFKDADYYLITSRFEGFPNALFESMVCGIVPISVNCLSGPYEIIMQSKNTQIVEDYKISDYGILVNLESENTVNNSLLKALNKYAHSDIKFKKLDFNKYSDEVALEKWREIIENNI